MFNIFLENKFIIKVKNIKVYYPNNIYIILWQCLLLIYLIMQIICFPIIESFSLDIEEYIFLNVSIYKIPIVLFVIDIIVIFNTGYYDFGAIVTDKVLIAKRYLKLKFVFDLICLILLV